MRAPFLFTLTLSFFTTGLCRELPAEMEIKSAFLIHPIGVVEADGDLTWIALNPEMQAGLLGLEPGTAIWVFWWFDRNDTPDQRGVLQVHPRGNPDNPLRGVFATRAPVRPNLIALTLCRVIKIEGPKIQVQSIDAFPGTPILDIKPYSPGQDTPEAQSP
jgi:tRNA-Thr(GGU) m(6)t(6)A37 methyltransferase TsaA